MTNEQPAPADTAAKPARGFLGKLIVGAAILAAAGIAYFGVYAETMMQELSPSYQARGFLPVIAALNAYHAAKGRFPAQAVEAAPYLPEGITAFNGTAKAKSTGFASDDENLGGFGGKDATGIWWYYNPDATGTAYALRRQVRDASLYYKFDGHKAKWVWYTGDGQTPEQELQLEP